MIGAGRDRERLVKLAGMFGSDHAGERANAAALADELVRRLGWRWPDVILPSLAGPDRRRDIENVQDAIKFALKFEDELTRWEVNFLSTLGRQLSPASVKQIAVLHGVVEKVRRAEARTA
jgi:hypothetical protein